MSWFKFGKKSKSQDIINPEAIQKELEKELAAVEAEQAFKEPEISEAAEVFEEPEIVAPIEETKEEVEIEEKPVEMPAEKPKKSFFAKLKEGLSKTRSAVFGRIDDVFYAFKSVDEDLFEELEEVLITADIGVDTSVYIIDLLRRAAKEKGIKEPADLKEELKNIIATILNEQNTECNLDASPAVIMVIGVNGVGKTTSIGKMANYYKSQGKKVLLAAADTFRAAAIDQLEIWANRAGVEIVKHQEGSDPSAVVFDAIAAAKSRGTDIVICDTAGRLHNKKHLMDELAKTARVIERETGHPASEVLLVLDASTGQNALIQAREFKNAAAITGVVLTKLDGTAKGGVVIALCREQNIGVKFIGVGEGIDDLQKFNPDEFAKALFPEE